MIDMFDFKIPFNPSFVIAGSEDYTSGWVDLESLGLSYLRSKNGLGCDGAYKILELEHPFESLKSSYTGMAFKVFKGNENYWPHVRIKASPAKLLQGHNVFGSDNPSLCGMELITLLSLCQPELFSKLDIEFTEIMNMDITYSARILSENLVIPFFDYLSNVNHKKLRFSKGFDSSVYFNKGSEHGQIKVYYKLWEFLKQLKDFKRENKQGDFDAVVAVMTDEMLQQFTLCLIRFEATFTNRKLKEMGIPTNFIKYCNYYEAIEEEGCSLNQELFTQKTRPLFEALKGDFMNVYNDDAVRNLLKSKHGKMNRYGKLNFDAAMSVFKTYRAIASDGFDSTKDSMSERTFRHHIKLMVDAGISKSSLQNLATGKAASVVPVLQLIRVDFCAQYPAWYVEPKSQLADGQLRLNKSRFSSSLRLVA